MAVCLLVLLLVLLLLAAALSLCPFPATALGGDYFSYIYALCRLKSVFALAGCHSASSLEALATLLVLRHCWGRGPVPSHEG